MICVFEKFKEKKMATTFFVLLYVSQFIEFQFHGVNKYKKYWYNEIRTEPKVTRISVYSDQTF